MPRGTGLFNSESFGCNRVALALSWEGKKPLCSMKAVIGFSLCMLLYRTSLESLSLDIYSAGQH